MIYPSLIHFLYLEASIPQNAIFHPSLLLPSLPVSLQWDNVGVPQSSILVLSPLCSPLMIFSHQSHGFKYQIDVSDPMSLPQAQFT